MEGEVTAHLHPAATGEDGASSARERTADGRRPEYVDGVTLAHEVVGPAGVP